MPLSFLCNINWLSGIIGCNQGDGDASRVIRAKEHDREQVKEIKDVSQSTDHNLIVENTGCGLLVNPLKPEKIAAAVVYLLENPKKRKEC